MKLSEAIKKGIARYPNPTVGANQRGDDKACVDGCAHYGYTGNAWAPFDSLPKEYSDGFNAFEKHYGKNMIAANDLEEVTREEIVAILEEINH